MNGPLQNLKILDFSTLLPGPYATMLMADMGAQVLRVESPTRPDLMKSMPPKYGDNSYAHLAINRNKQSLAVDLKRPDARDIIIALLDEYDVLVEQFRPGVMKKLGLDYSELKKIKPELIYCSITGYGQTGSHKNRAGHDINYLALSGLASYSGRKQSGPSLSATQVADVAGGSHHAVMGILAAEIERQSTGKGQYLDISICAATFTLNTIFGASALASGIDPDYEDQVLNGGSFYDYYQTQDERYISVGALEPKFAELFFETIQKPQWLARTMLPLGEQQSLKDDISALIKQQPLKHWQHVFAETDCCVEPVLSINEVTQSDFVRERKMIVELTLEANKKIKQIAPAIQFAEHSSSFSVGKLLGENTISVLKKVGYSENQINRLLKNKTVSATDYSQKD
jgi:alpha-methylacyl-CoA racemase